MSARRMDIVFLKQIENTFLGRLDASIGIGFDIAKANNFTASYNPEQPWLYWQLLGRQLPRLIL